MLPGLLLAIGVTGLIWWTLQEFTRLKSTTTDGIAAVSGLAVALLVSLINRGLIQDPVQVVAGIFVLSLSYVLIRIEPKRRANKKGAVTTQR